jgi:hypothetical protein
MLKFHESLITSRLLESRELKNLFKLYELIYDPFMLSVFKFYINKESVNLIIALSSIIFFIFSL